MGHMGHTEIILQLRTILHLLKNQLETINLIVKLLILVMIPVYIHKYIFIDKILKKFPFAATLFHINNNQEIICVYMCIPHDNYK